VLFVVEWEELFNENQATKFKVHTKMSSRIGVLRIFPGITPEAVSVLTVCLTAHCTKYLMVQYQERFWELRFGELIGTRKISSYCMTFKGFI